MLHLFYRFPKLSERVPFSLDEFFGCFIATLETWTTSGNNRLAVVVVGILLVLYRIM